MTESLPAAAWGRWRQGVRFLIRVGRRTLVESLYLLTGPVTATTGLLLALGGLCAGTVVRRPGTRADRHGTLRSRQSGGNGPAAQTEGGSRSVRPRPVARHGARGGGAPRRPGHPGGGGGVGGCLG